MLDILLLIITRSTYCMLPPTTHPLVQVVEGVVQAVAQQHPSLLQEDRPADPWSTSIFSNESRESMVQPLTVTVKLNLHLCSPPTPTAYSRKRWCHRPRLAFRQTRHTAASTLSTLKIDPELRPRLRLLGEELGSLRPHKEWCQQLCIAFRTWTDPAATLHFLANIHFHCDFKTSMRPILRLRRRLSHDVSGPVLPLRHTGLHFTRAKLHSEMWLSSHRQLHTPTTTSGPSTP